MGGILTETRQKATKSGGLMGFVTLEDLTGSIESLVFPKVLERVGHALIADTPVILSGRLSIREEDDPKLLLDRVDPLPPNGSQQPVTENRTLWLRLPDDDAIPYVSDLLAGSPGNAPVMLYLKNTRQKLRAPDTLRVTPDDALLKALYEMLGEENVVLK